MSDGSVRWRARDVRCRYQVGDIVPKVVTPKDYEYLLVCDGSSFDTSKYPLLAEVFPDGVLPNLMERFLEGATTPKQYREAGLPEIYGNTDIGGFSGIYTEATGAFHSTIVAPNATVATAASADTNLEVVDFMASRYNPIYGKSTTVQPASYTVTYYVCYGG